MLVNFTKMHVLGNDFIMIDAITQKIKLHSAYIKKIANRNTGIGCDQIILLEPPKEPTADYYYKIYNANGKIAEQCLNGARCTARFALDSGLVNKQTIVADCMAGRVTFSVENNLLISANLGIINPAINSYLLKLKNSNIDCKIHSLSIGNPHAIVLLPNEISTEYPEIEHPKYCLLAEDINNQDMFSSGINIGFIRVIDANSIRLRVFERGVGETLSCGSNTVAAFLVAKHLKLIANRAKILFKLGTLHVKLENDCLIIRGPTNSVFIGKFKI
ncbi:MAG: diaminopimelate epimerase [Gammaproteobacteria bacterium]